MVKRYEVTLPDGRIVSRQYAWQLRHPDKQKVFNLRYRRGAGRTRLDAFLAEYYLLHGESYYKKYNDRKREKRNANKVKE
jgi:hypothetical protein